MESKAIPSAREWFIATRIGAIRVVADDQRNLLRSLSIGDLGKLVAGEGEGKLAEVLIGLRLPPVRTPFLKRVREILAGIPPGETVTYGELAERVGSPGAARAVGQAMARNAFAMVVPCHRVVPASGGFGSYRWGGDRKEALLRLERETGLDAWRVL